MTRLTEADRRQKFFYAEHAANMYDTTIRFVAPGYDLMHNMMLELLKYHFRVNEGAESQSVKGDILDIGSGTGSESIKVLRAFPSIRIVGLDLCAPMHEEFRRNFLAELPGEDLTTRCSLVVGDLLADAGSVSALRSHLSPEWADRGYRAVISAFTLHHLTTEEKEEAYRRIYEVLEPGGILINGDLFTFHASQLEAYSNAYDLNHIRKDFDKAKKDGTLDKARADDLKNAWLKHYQFDNILDPIESAEVAIKAPTTQDMMRGQAGMLRRVGFQEVGSPFRFWQVGLLWAKK